MKTDPHHCRCFKIEKPDFLNFEAKLRSSGFTDPILEEDHGQILSFTKRLSQYYQIHIKLLRTGRVEAEIEYPQDYPGAHLNSIHSYSAHKELGLILISLNIPHKTRKKPPITCIRPQIIPAKDPTKIDTFAKIGGVAALLDIIFNDGKATKKVIDIGLKELNKSFERKRKRRKYLK